MFLAGSGMPWLYESKSFHRGDQLSEYIQIVEARCEKSEMPVTAGDGLESDV